jgi:hypothetical protein
LRAVPAVACIQPWLAGKLHDLLALEDRALLALLDAHPGVGAEFAAFARQTLAWHRRGTFPDLLGAGNLVLVEGPGQARLWLLDYGIFDPACAPAPDVVRAAMQGMASRLLSLLERMGKHVDVPG